VRVPKNVVEARRQLLADLLQNQRYLPLEQICIRLSISEATARRDLVELQRSGRIKRTPGGALTEFSEKFPTFAERLGKDSAKKNGLARRILPYCTSGSTVYIDGGTTPFALARLLPEAEIPGLKVVTNSLPVVELLSGSGVSLHIPGGNLVARQSLLIGERAVRALSEWKIDVAVLGAEGVTQAGVWNSALEVVALQKAAIANSKRSFVLVTAEKIGHRAGAQLATWSSGLELVTDATEKQLQSARIPLAKMEVG
jgi:DeoR/GlpR family transcriptional regulator of sugar metabolism